MTTEPEERCNRAGCLGTAVVVPDYSGACSLQCRDMHAKETEIAGLEGMINNFAVRLVDVEAALNAMNAPCGDVVCSEIEVIPGQFIDSSAPDIVDFPGDKNLSWGPALGVLGLSVLSVLRSDISYMEEDCAKQNITSIYLHGRKEPLRARLPKAACMRIWVEQDVQD